jgi:acyl carrier protein
MKINSQSEIAQNIASLFTLLLKKEIMIESDIVRENESAWDSLLNLELIISLEDSFAIQFTPEEIEFMDSKLKVQMIILKKLHGNM